MQALADLYRQWAGEDPVESLSLGGGGSNRCYFRLSSPGRSCIAAIGDDLRENEAFIAYSRSLAAAGMPVPQIYAISPDGSRYLQQDLGDTTLHNLLLDKKRSGQGFDAEMLSLYRRALADLAALQQAGRNLDFRLAVPRSDFDHQSMQWDLNYFKYCFLKPLHIPFDEQRLEDSFEALIRHLLAADCTLFMYRDFQPRNIMVNPARSADGSSVEPPLYYIDYQGGRRGAAQYDVASLLYSPKGDLPQVLRSDLLNHYLNCREIKGREREQWMSHFWGYVLIRILQAFGAYGYRGLYERKSHFVQSIPLAAGNLRRLLDDHWCDLPAGLDELERVCDALCALPRTAIPGLSEEPTNNGVLTVEIGSFSYRNGLPDDRSGHGGGFIFDCRALPNPGRYAEYRSYTGRDRPVRQFLQAEPAIGQFLQHVQSLAAQSIEKYLERGFTHLSIHFGCTGGQHRSVYCAEQLAAWVRRTYPCQVRLCHREQDKSQP